VQHLVLKLEGRTADNTGMPIWVHPLPQSGHAIHEHARLACQ
jgi:hypothetical protein